MSIPQYPIKFVPILKEKVWGGQKLQQLLKKPAVSKHTGESWELSGVENNISVVANGVLKGTSLDALIEQYGASLLGHRVVKSYGQQFPLLFKFIDAKDVLSVQLHPDDALAKKRHNSFGKTEMWYIVQADKNSGLYLGFHQPMHKALYLEHLNKNTLEEIINFQEVRPGEAFFVPPGVIHAIGKGVLLAEIQQTSDITYRVYDWNRPDIDGNMRELHNELAMEAIDFDVKPKTLQCATQNAENTSLVDTSYFACNRLIIDKTIFRKLHHDSFVVYMCVSGQATITTAGNQEVIHFGETVLLPASCRAVTLQAEKATLLEVYIP